MRQKIWLEMETHEKKNLLRVSDIQAQRLDSEEKLGKVMGHGGDGHSADRCSFRSKMHQHRMSESAAIHSQTTNQASVHISNTKEL